MREAEIQFLRDNTSGKLIAPQTYARAVTFDGGDTLQSKLDKGELNGPVGKSAYQQAVEGGLSATEAEFKSALARAVTAFGDWSSGLTPEEEIDPEIVYERTRPVDWMKMPALEDVRDGEFWLLFQWLPGDVTECSFTMRANSDIKVEAGRYEDGVFIPQEKYTQSYTPKSATDNMTVPIALNGDDFEDLTSTGRVQAMVRISGEITYITVKSTSYPQYVDGTISAKDLQNLALSRNSTLTYFAIVNMCDHITDVSFRYNSWLRAVRGTFAAINGFSANANTMFGSCTSLVAIPLDATFASFFDVSGTGYSAAIFASCYSLKRLPEGATFASAIIGGTESKYGASMFSGCHSLLELPAGMTLQNITNGQGMFQDCYSLRELPGGMTLENVTNGQSMLQGCSSLRKLPSGVTFAKVTNGQSMLSGCTALRELPAGVTFENLSNGKSMFLSCYALRELPSASFPEAANLASIFQNCSSLQRIKNLYIPKCSNLTNAFSGCSLLEELTFAPCMETWETPQDIDLRDTRLSHAAIMALFESLPAITTAKTITLTGTPGASQVTAEDIAIAEAKGWRVAGTAASDPGLEEPEIFDDREDRYEGPVL